MKSAIQVLAATIILTQAIAGCVSNPPPQFNVAAADQISIGRSTKEDVVHLLGEPKTVYQTAATGERWTYTNINADNTGVNTVMLTGGLSFIVNPSSMFGSTETETVTISFAGNLVSNCVITTHNTDFQAVSKYIERRCGSNAGSIPTHTTTVPK